MGRRKITVVKLKNQDLKELDIVPIKRCIYTDLYEINIGQRLVGYFGHSRTKLIEELALFNACNLFIGLKLSDTELALIENTIHTRFGKTSIIMVSESPVLTRKRLFILPLNGEEDIESTLKSKVRSQIKGTYKKGLNTSIVDFEYGLAEFHRLYVLNMRDIGSLSFPKKMFVRAHETLDLRIFLTSINGQNIAAGLLVLESNHCEVSFAGIDRQYSKYSPNMQLYAEMINYAIRNSKTFFSFGTSDVGSSQMRFKSQFGAKSYHYMILSKGISHSWLSQFKGLLKYFIHSKGTSLTFGRIYSLLMYKI